MVAPFFDPSLTPTYFKPPLGLMTSPKKNYLASLLMFMNIASIITNPKTIILFEPPLKITNLTLHTQECNPNKDILTNFLTIQTHNENSHIYK